CYHDGNGLVRRRVKGNTVPALAQSDLVQRVLVGPATLRSSERRGHMPDAGSRLWPGIETAQYQPRSVLRGLDGGEDQSLALEPDFDRSRAERGCLAKPSGADREEG